MSIANENVEQRLSALEAAVAHLQQQVAPRKKRWIDHFIGSMADDPEFEAVVKEGAEWRKQQRLPEDSQP